MPIFKRKCKHNWKVHQRSNILQLDDMGYPLRLCICKCGKCSQSDQQWIDVSTDDCKELDAYKSILLEWS